MKRTCKGITKKGTPCKGNPLKDSDYCLAHADEQKRASVGFGGARAGAMGGRPKKPSPTEIERRLIEENVIAWQRPYWRTLGYDMVMGADGPELLEREDGGAKLFGESKDGYINVSDHEDLGAMIAAAEKLRDRVFGRPKQFSEVTVVTEDQLVAEIERMERELADNDRDSGAAGDDPALQDAANAA